MNIQRSFDGEEVEVMDADQFEDLKQEQTDHTREALDSFNNF